MSNSTDWLIALDLDGTLLTSKKTIGWKTKKYLAKLDKKGHLIVLASGRPKRALLRYYEELGLKGPFIGYNGALINAPFDPTFPNKEARLPQKLVIDMSQRLAQKAENIICETNTDMWLMKDDPHLTRFFWDEGMNIHHGRIKDILDDDPLTMIIKAPTADDGAPKEISPAERARINDWLKDRPDLAFRFWPGDRYFELAYEKTTKGEALRIIAEHYHIPQEKIIAFGDAENDLSMLKYAAHPFLMKNAYPDVLRKVPPSHWTRRTNDRNGVLHALKAFFRNQPAERKPRRS